MREKDFLMMRCPPIMISRPTGIAGEDVSIELETMAFIPVRTVLIGGTADIALKHELLFRHGPPSVPLV
jgi:hypothetical protein